MRCGHGIGFSSTTKVEEKIHLGPFDLCGKDKPPTPQEAIQRLRNVEEMLLKKSIFVETKIASELETARKNGKNNKRAALQALKRKKRYEKQLQQLDGTLSTIEIQRESLENVGYSVEVFKVMEETSKALSDIHKHLDLDKISDLKDEIDEQLQISEDVMDVLSKPFSSQSYLEDEDELLAELEDLYQEDLDAQLLDVGRSVNLPGVPSVEPIPVHKRKDHQTTDTKEEDMSELAMWAS